MRPSPAQRVWILLAVVCASCTDPIDRKESRVEVIIDADLDVRSETVRVLVEVETQAEPGSGWASTPPRTFKADPDEIAWPIRYRLPPISDGKVSSVSLIATAHDEQGAVVARVQAIRPLDRAFRAGIRVHFDTRCFRQTSLCGDGRTCAGGECVSARDEEAPPTGATGDKTGSPASPSMAAGRDPNAGLAQVGAPCQANARACAGRGSQTPLHCDEGVWKEGEACGENDRCDGNAGPTLGQCRAIARECANQEPLVPFCDGDVMRVCTDLVTSDVRPCNPHMRCVQKPDSVNCECQPGFIDYEGVCSEATECTSNGGCDTLTSCQIVGGVRMCGACPSGYTGRGEDGCEPLLSALTSNAGALSPALDPNTRSYRLRVPLLVQRVELRASAPPGTRITYNAAEVAPGEAWTSPPLRRGEQLVNLELISQFGVSTRYEITIERTGALEVALKAETPGAEDLFGYSIAMSGNTLVASSECEDSAPGNPENNALEQSGAVYTFVRDANGWRADGYLKPEDAQAGDYFGESVALEGDTLVVGAVRANVLLTSGSRSGLAYVYTRQNGAWKLQQRLSASNPASGDMFGATVSLAGSTLAVGALYGSAGSERNGAVYIFERMGSEWVERQILAPSVTNQGPGKYACDLQLDGDRLIVGESGKELTRSHRGSAYIYVRRNGKWAEEQRLVSDTTPVDSQYGWSVALRGDRAVVGAPSPPQLRADESTSPGEVYIYERGADGWRQTAFLRAPFPAQSDFFGAGLALTDHVLAIGSNGERSSATGFDGDRRGTGAMASGAVYLYTNTLEGRWVPSTYIKATKPHPGDWLGWQVLLTDDELVAAAPYERSGARGVNTAIPDTEASASGAVFVYR